MSDQLKLSECVTCENCEFGRNLGANDYGCRNNILYETGVIDKRVHKSTFSCNNGKPKGA